MTIARFASLCAGVLVVVGVALGATKCVSDTVGETASSDTRLPVDTAVVSFLSKARAAHHAADLLEREGNLEGASRSVETITSGSRPPLTPEVREVLADAFARRAELASRTGAFDQALESVELGLGFAVEDTHFRGHLFEVRGLVYERRFEALEQAGRHDEASLAKESALRAFEAAISVQERVIHQALGPAK